MEADASNQPAEKFCPQCGLSTVPLDVPHLSAECDKCPRTVHFVRHGPNGEGIQVKAGERFTIPQGFIKLSLEPSPGGKLFRSGLPFLLNKFFIGRHPTEEGILSFIDEAEAEFDALLAKTEAAKGLDLTNDADVTKLAEQLRQDTLSRDWYIFSCAMFCGGVKWSLENNKPERAAWAGYMLGTLRGLSIVSEPLFEETLWRGYLANEVVFEAAAAAGNKSPAEIEALKKLQPLFREFDEATLHALVESGLPIGPKINIKTIPDELLRALAKHQLATIERERQETKQAEKERKEDERLTRKDRREETELRIKWAGVGAVGVSTVVGILALVAKFM